MCVSANRYSDNSVCLIENICAHVCCLGSGSSITSRQLYSCGCGPTVSVASSSSSCLDPSL